MPACGPRHSPCGCVCVCAGVCVRASSVLVVLVRFSTCGSEMEPKTATTFVGRAGPA